MSSTGKVLGTIGAMHALVENFPMNLLDLFKGKVYTSAFDFIVDVLIACGVPYEDIVKELLEKIYAIEPQMIKNMNHLENQLLDKNLLDSQSEFLKGLEYSIKGILMSLLSSVYTCSAIPVLPNKYFDKPNEESFSGLNKNLLKLWKNENGYIPTPGDDDLENPGQTTLTSPYPVSLEIPINLLDPMGILEICPTSTDGKLYYTIEGGDKYYKKIKYDSDLESTILSSHNVEVENIPIYLESTDKGIVFKTDIPILETINISVGYIEYNDENLCVWEDKILIGENQSNELRLLPRKNNSKASVIRWITINKEHGGCYNIDNDAWIYLSREKSKTVIDLWDKNKAFSLSELDDWGREQSNNILLMAVENSKTYRYVEEEYSKKYKDAVRVSRVPSEPREQDPEYVVCYEGVSPNDLYKTYDMNAFIWYCINKGNIYPQTEYNHLMWDSRYLAYKSGTDLRNQVINENSNIAQQWNDWYASKSGNSGEFLINGEKIENTSSLYPIVQLIPPSNGFYSLGLTFPAQTYFKPRVRNGKSETPELVFNASIYKFNWDYLESIQILKPNLMLVGLCNYLLGFTLRTASSVKINLTKKMISEKISEAVKNIIKADDMEVEDCYMSFSNEEFDELLENMLLSRYDATYYGGDTATVKVHDVDYYMGMLNSINHSTDKNESITSISKLITEVSVDPGTEASIEYGVQLSTDRNILNDLIWAIVMPIVESLFTPQVMLLLLTNFRLMGITKFDKSLGNDFGLILNFFMNKILGLIKSIVRYVKDKIVELLLMFFYNKVLPLLIKWQAAVQLEKIQYWLDILNAALACLPRFKFKKQKIKGTIDDVDYADITTEQTIPETQSGC